jgi:putative hydrolase
MGLLCHYSDSEVARASCLFFYLKIFYFFMNEFIMRIYNEYMIDLHTHSILSDGELLPSELIHRAEHIGYTAIAITDHADISNLDWIIPRVVEVCQWCNRFRKIKAIPGIELTHIPPEAISEMAEMARKLGAVIVNVHGETLAEPVAPKTNLAALESNIDILAHPGLITEEEAQLAAYRGICLEISTRKGHSLSNGHVAKMALRAGAKLLINSDAHGPADLMTSDKAIKIAQGAGLEMTQIETIMTNAQQMVGKALERLTKRSSYED